MRNKSLKSPKKPKLLMRLMQTLCKPPKEKPNRLSFSDNNVWIKILIPNSSIPGEGL
jgi:hypothetical protein